LQAQIDKTGNVIGEACAALIEKENSRQFCRATWIPYFPPRTEVKKFIVKAAA